MTEIDMNNPGAVSALAMDNLTQQHDTAQAKADDALMYATGLPASQVQANRDEITRHITRESVRAAKMGPVTTLFYTDEHNAAVAAADVKDLSAMEQLGGWWLEGRDEREAARLTGEVEGASFDVA